MRKAIIQSMLLSAVILASSAILSAQSFSVQRIGNGQQSLIFIPGFACAGDVWQQTVDSLQNNYSCYVLTMPGFAGVAPESNPSFHGWATQIVHFIQQENIHNPVIIGHSMGGGLALYIASKHPQLVKSIVVVDALPCLAALYDPNFRSREISREEFAAFESQILMMDDEQFYKQAYISATSLTSDATRYDDLVNWSLTSDRKTYAHMYYEYTNIDLRPGMADITVPALVLLEFPFQRFAQAVEAQFGNGPSFSLQYAQKGLHFIMYDDWEWYAKQVMDFLEK